jgi:hypothetical protein
MNKSTVVWISLLVILAGVYVYYFTDWLVRPTIQIIPQSRPNKKSSLNPDVYLTSFMLDGSYKLTSIRVYKASEIKTNKYASPIWHMVSESNSAPVKVVHYGVPIVGMKPSIPKSRPQPLEPDITYNIVIEAGKIKGEKEFQARAVAQN